MIPIGAFTSMVHTVSGIVLHRLHRMLNAGDVPYEAAMVIGAMVDLVKEVDPMFFEKIGFEHVRARRRCPSWRFPTRAPSATPSPPNSIAAWAAACRGCATGRPAPSAWSPTRVRATFGLTTAEMDDAEAIDRVMNPARNPYRVDMLDVAYHSPMMRALNHASYVFEKRLSHTADSQDQRHRMVPASRPMMTLADTIAPDYVTPRLIRQNPAALAVYEQAMADAWTAKNRLLALGVPLEYALYVVPNAKALRLVESGSFIALQHKWTLRTCFNAQEEIYLASMDEISQVQGDSPAARALPRPAVRAAQQDRVAALHRRHALLRRAGLEHVPERRAPTLKWCRSCPGSRTSTPRPAPSSRCSPPAMTFAHNFRARLHLPGRRDVRRRHRRRAGARAAG